MKNSARCSSLVCLSFALLALLVTPALGQQDNQNNSNPDVSRVPREIQGCLNGASGNFTLETETGVVYQVKGDNSVLSSHSGQQVDVVGTEIVSTPSGLPANSNPQADANQTAAPETIVPPTLLVSKMVKMKDKCYRPR
jgi:hypothetical protein